MQEVEIFSLQPSPNNKLQGVVDRLKLHGLKHFYTQLDR